MATKKHLKLAQVSEWRGESGVDKAELTEDLNRPCCVSVFVFAQNTTNSCFNCYLRASVYTIYIYIYITLFAKWQQYKNNKQLN